MNILYKISLHNQNSRYPLTKRIFVVISSWNILKKKDYQMEKGLITEIIALLIVISISYF